MKTNYIKSISLIVLGGILALGISSLMKLNPDKTADQVESNTITKRTPNISNRVDLDVAAEGISMYRLWLKYVPKTFQLEDSSLVFSNVVIPLGDRELVSCLVDSIKTNLNINGSDIPFAPANSRDFAYFISKDDIQDAWDNTSDPEDVSGIRIYTAPKDLSAHDTSLVSTHVYVVATIGEGNNDYIPSDEGNKYVYDLTAPCPASCGDTNPLNQFSLECPNS